LAIYTIKMTKKSYKYNQSLQQGSIIENVSGTYSDDYDIIHLDQIVLEYLEYHEIKRSGEIDQQNKEYENQLKNYEKLTELQQKYYMKKLQINLQELEEIKNHKKINDYKSNVERLLELYRMAGGGTRKVKFGQLSVMYTKEEEELKPYRLEIIRNYLSIAKKYMSINIIEMVPPNIKCPGCDYDLHNVFSDENGIQRCPKCFFERSLPSRGYCSSTNATMETISVKSNRNDNEEKENFIKAIIRHEGRQKDKFPTDLFSKLDHYFLSNNLPIGEEIKNGNAPQISRERMFIALSYIGYPYYEHVNLIMHKYLGTKLPDISHLENLLMLHFDLTHKSAQENGIDPINTQFRLFKQLEMLGEPVHISEFRVPKTRDIIETDQENWRLMCEATGEYGKEMGIKYIPTL